jgi:glycosidase
MVLAQNAPVDSEGHQWWHHAVFYELYPRSFADSNDDGIGDLNGTPMQWNTSVNAGFSQPKPWLSVPASYKTHNVETELKDPNSVLSFYQKLLAVRRTNRAPARWQVRAAE